MREEIHALSMQTLHARGLGGGRRVRPRPNASFSPDSRQILARVSVNRTAAWTSCDPRRRAAPRRGPRVGRQERGAADHVRGAAHVRRRCGSPTSRDCATCARCSSCSRRWASRVERDGDAVNCSPPTASTRPVAPYELVKTMRASILVLGPLARALRRSARVAARGLRDRPAAGRPARQGPAGDGRGDRASSTATSIARAPRLTGARIAWTS